MSADAEPEVRRRYTALLAEIRRDQEWCDDLRRSPYAPDRFARELAALGADAVPAAIAGLAQPDAAVAQWAAFALSCIGPPAAAAVEPLQAAARAHGGEAAEVAL